MEFNNEEIDTFANRLLIAMKKNNINQIELSEKTTLHGKKISQSLINKYLKGKAFARQDNIYILSKILNVNEVWLMGYNVPMDKNFGRTETKHINVYNLKTNEVVQTIPYEYRPDIAEDDPKNFFAIQASDNSMAPLLDVGDIAIIKKYKEFLNKKTYLLKIKGGFPIIRKIIQTDNGEIELQAMNMWNFPIQNGLKMEDIEILGEVIRVENKSAFK